MLEGLALSDTDHYAEQGVLNVIDANDFVESLATSDSALGLAAVREVHKRTMAGLLPHPGEFRQEDVKITGASFVPPVAGDVPDLVRDATRRFEAFRTGPSGEHPIVAACWLHVSLAAIHPFPDGNGRVARLMQDYASLRGGLLPVGIPAGRRQEYYDALMAADEGDWKAILSIVINSELTVLERTRRIAEAPSKREKEFGR